MEKWKKEKKFIRKCWLDIPVEKRGKIKLIIRNNNNYRLQASMEPTKHFLFIYGSYCKQIAKLNRTFAYMLMRQTFGHELAHLCDKYYYRIWFFENIKKYQFVSKVNEVHADILGASMFSISRSDLIKILKYKRKINGDRYSRSHPTWSQRIKYAEYGKVDKYLVLAIADECDYHDTNIIQEASAMYKEIIL